MDAQKKMGLRIPGDEKVTVPARHWQAARLALWRSKHAWDIAMREAKQVLDRCEHAPECAGKGNETEVCQRDCPGREARLSALVILNAGRQFTIDVNRPADAPYFAPSREHFSEVIGELLACQAELEAIRGAAVTSPDSIVPVLKEGP